MAKKYLFTSESVSEGHPDKVADQISDAVLDDCLRLHPMARVAIETLVTTNYVLVAGEVGGTGEVDLDPIVRDAVKRVVARIGYKGADFSPETIRIDVRIHAQSKEIFAGVEVDGAGDQGLMFGYACRETPEFMPAALQYAHAIVKELARLRHAGDTRLGPDAKSQVTLEYVDGKPVRAHTVVVSHQHRKGVTTEELRPLFREVVERVLPKGWVDGDTTLLVNPTGSFVQGGPAADTGLTGRKIIVDTYGGSAPHGGGAFSGKDPSKVDRSAAYAARWVAKNIVAAGLAERCTVQVAYAIGVAEPVSLYVDTHGTGRVDDARIEAAVLASCSLTPKSIRDRLGLRAPIYMRTASYGHFGRMPEADGGFSWERLDLVEELKRHVG